MIVLQGLTTASPCVVIHQGVAIESHEADEEGALQFEQGDVILVLADTLEVSVCVCV